MSKFERPSEKFSISENSFRRERKRERETKTVRNREKRESEIKRERERENKYANIILLDTKKASLFTQSKYSLASKKICLMWPGKE